MRRAAISCLLACAEIAFGGAAQAKGDSARILRDIPYYPESAYTNDYIGKYARLDLRIPQGVSNFATVVTFHGGGLVRGFRGDFYKESTADDVASVSAGYRLLTNATPAECVGDAAAAVAWTLRHIREYGGDPKKVFVSGYSGGGYLALMVGMDPKWLKPHGYRPKNLAGIMSSTGQASTHFTIRKTLGDDTSTYLTKVDEWAPLSYASRDLPPILLMTGESGLDIPCRPEENRLLYASLKALGHRDVACVSFPGRCHNDVWADHGPYKENFIRRLSCAGRVSKESGSAPYREVPLGDVPFAMAPLQECVFPDRAFSIADFGAKPDGSKCTAAFASAVRAAHEQGGGRVVVPAGTWFTGAIHLKDNVELHLAEGAVVDFSDDPKDYEPAVIAPFEGVECWNRSPLVYASECTNVAVTGKGVLRPRLGYWLEALAGDRNANPVSRYAMKVLRDWSFDGTPIAQRNCLKLPGSRMRPSTVLFNRCRNVRLDGFRIKGSPFWTIHLYRCDGAIVRGLDVCCHSDERHVDGWGPQGWSAGVLNCLNNADGIDVDMTRNVLIEDCTFCQNDDGIVLKSGWGPDGYLRGVPTENVVVRRCNVKLGHGLLVIGSEMSGGVRNVLIEDCSLSGSIRKLLFVKCNRLRGGFVQNITMRNVRAPRVTEDLLCVSSDYGYRVGDDPAHETKPSEIGGIRMENVEVGEAHNGIMVFGPDGRPVEGVCAKGVRIGKLTGIVAQGGNVRDFDVADIKVKSAGN